MHDIDQTMLEAEDSYLEETEGGESLEDAFEQDRVLSEEEEMEAASDLLTVSSEEELEQFLGNLFKKVARTVGKVIKSPLGRTLGGVLKGVARKVLPLAGSALGNIVAPGVGGMVGGGLASAAGKIFGLELEGMSAEDQEFETARRFVRLASTAAARAASGPQTAPLPQVVKAAILGAAKKHAPGLVGRRPGIVYGGHGGGRYTGHWIRRGTKIILFGV